MDILKESKVFHNNNEIQWEEAGTGIKRQIFGYDDKIMLVKVKFEKGAVGAMHQHPHSQVGYVESGVFLFTVGGEKSILRSGDGFYITPNTMHGSICLEPGILIDVFSPHREDFLEGKHQLLK